MTNSTLTELFTDNLRDVYDAEKQLVKTLPKLAKAADSEELAEAIRDHLVETQNHVSRLESVFETMGAPAKSKPCKGMRGLIDEGKETMDEEDEGVLRDLAIIAAAQKVEHYEISAYGTLRTIAEQMENEEAVNLLQETEDEEKAADTKLTEIATNLYQSIGQEDSEADSEEEEEEAPKARKPARPAARRAVGRAARS